MHELKRTLSLTLIAVLILPAGCSTRQWYGAGQAWQHGECQREVNEAEYRRCVDGANLRFEDYVRQRDADHSRTGDE